MEMGRQLVEVCLVLQGQASFTDTVVPFGVEPKCTATHTVDESNIINAAIISIQRKPSAAVSIIQFRESPVSNMRNQSPSAAPKI